ncbi:PrgI family protein [Patescibacteria group bacterium]|nr:PrgI family protein [Patescibacteria group bacterium]
MEQHPIPQQITSYEFKLVGEMTLKQFAKAAVGVIIALLINATKLVFFIKWPLIFIFAGGGLALAFVPYHDRPLEVWIQAFLKSIYAPTIYRYKKRSPKNWLDIDLTKTIKSNETEDEKLDLPEKQGEKVKEFINSLPSVHRENEESEEEKKERLELILKKEEKEEKVLPEVKEEVAKEEVETEKKEDYGTANLDLKKEKLGATGQAVFGEIPMPDIPDMPNLVVGMVLDKASKIVEGAIIEIQDKEGNPSRVLKTNQLGQFKTLTQLADGKYLVVTDKDGLEFDRVEINLEGKIVKPIKIIAK